MESKLLSKSGQSSCEPLDFVARSGFGKMGSYTSNADSGTVLRYAIAAIYTNLSTSIIDNECFGKDGTFVTGGPGDKLILKFEETA